MSDSEDGGGPGNREVAYRLFAAEFDDADLSYSESDEERAPNYVVTPTGARVNRLFVVGVLTEVETVSEDYLRARVVDPTGPFVVYAGQYQPEALAFLDGADTPTFVAVTGKARTFQPEDSDRVYTSVRPESINEVDADARDRWVVGTAERTVDRVATAAAAIDSGLEGDGLRAALEANGVDESLAAGLPIALDHYGTTGEYLAAVRELSLDAARVVAGEIDEVEPLTAAPDAGTDDPVPELIEEPIDLDAAELESEEIDSESEGAPAADPDEDREPTGSATGSERTSADAGVDDAASDETASEAATNEDEPEKASGDESTTAADPNASVDPAAESPADVGTESEASTAAETEAEASTDAGTAAESPADVGTESETEAGAGAGEDDEADAESDESLEDFDPEFELDEDEREEIESEFGTDFQSGTEVDEPGEAGIETTDEPEPADETAEAGDAETAQENDAGSAEPEAEADEEEAVEADDEDETAAAEGATEDEAAAGATEAESDDDEGTETDDEATGTDAEGEDVDLEDAVVDAMGDLDEGDGADRGAVVDAVVDRTGADADEVDDAVQEALMGGRCYEPADDRLKPI